MPVDQLLVGGSFQWPPPKEEEEDEQGLPASPMYIDSRQGFGQESYDQHFSHHHQQFEEQQQQQSIQATPPSILKQTQPSYQPEPEPEPVPAPVLGPGQNMTTPRRGMGVLKQQLPGMRVPVCGACEGQIRLESKMIFSKVLLVSMSLSIFINNQLNLHICQSCEV